MKKTIHWVNSLKFLGIFAIYLGHYQAYGAGKFYEFVFSYHVPLFFFVAGFFDDIHDLSFKDYFFKNIKKLLLPYYLLSFIYILIWLLFNKMSIDSLIGVFLYTLFGVKDGLLAFSLWFIPCLFSMKMINYFIKKIADRKGNFVYIFMAILFLFVRYFIFKKIGLVGIPKLIFSVDSVFEYYVYFVIGKLIYDKINVLLLSINVKKKNKIKYLSFTIFALSLLLGIYTFFYPINCYKIDNTFLFVVCYITKALVLIVLNCYIAFFISKVKLFLDVGKQTLNLCGTEQLIKIFFVNLFNLFSFDINAFLSNPYYTIVYVFILLLINTYILSPIINKILKRYIFKEENK